MAIKTIYLYLHSILPIQASWVCVDDSDAIIETHLRSELSQLVYNHNPELIVIIPDQEIVLTYAELPKLSQNRLRQALPFTMEDKLIDNVLELHFAIGEYKAENYWPVAVINQEKMRQLIALFDQFNLRPNKIIPIILTLPLLEDHWTIYCLDNTCFVRISAYAGFSCESDNLSIYLEAKFKEESQKPAQIDLYAKEKFPFPLNSDYPIVFHQTTDTQLIDILSQQIKKSPFINLLQGIFRTKHKLTEVKKYWLYAAYLTAAWIGIGFFNNLFSLLLLEYQAGKTQSAINVIYKHQFPEATSVVSPKTRMEEKLKDITKEASNQSFLVLIANVSKAYAQTPGFHLKNLEYRDKQLIMDISTSSFDDLDLLTQALQKNGLSVKQQHAEIVAGQVNAALQINAGGP